MSDLDFDLDHLDFDAAADSVAKQQEAEQARVADFQADDDDECSGGACKI
ncbi:hypothetical protein QE250_08555 [Chromatiaceae bacterium AAb-1]|nr:hypothetical protein [Chromatiaceae bacterium AAb-1]